MKIAFCEANLYPGVFFISETKTLRNPFSLLCVEWLQSAAKMNQPVRILSLSSSKEQYFGAKCLFHQLHWISITIIVFGSIIRDVVSLIVHLLSPGQEGIKIANISKLSTNEFSIWLKMSNFPGFHRCTSGPLGGEV